MSVGKSSIKRVGTTETKPVAAKVAEEKAPEVKKTAKKCAAKKTASAPKSAPKAKSGAVALTDELPYYLL